MPFTNKHIGIGASSAGLVLAGPLFRQFNEIHYRYIFNNCTCLLQPDHFKSPSYVPETSHSTQEKYQKNITCLLPMALLLVLHTHNVTIKTKTSSDVFRYTFVLQWQLYIVCIVFKLLQDIVLDTWAHYSCILKVRASVYTNSTICAVSNQCFCSITAHIIQEDGSPSLAKPCY